MSAPFPHPSDEDDAHWFGFDRLAPQAKDAGVQRVFSSVADSYDRMNDLMSLGLHRLWKDRLIGAIAPRSHEVLVDVAGGTGDVAERFVQAGGGRAVLVDRNAAMVAAGRDRALDRGHMRGVTRLVGDAECLPVADGAADVVTIAFGLRNVTRRVQALAQMRRVLRPGGRFFCLEFGPDVTPGWFRRAYDMWSFGAMPMLGALVAGDRPAYEYLAQSIRTFPGAQALAQEMGKAGFEHVSWQSWLGGIVVLHRGQAPIHLKK
ncbi:MAG: class I SAM-dependent methyltransferase [Alphaproteobacteria bacterium]|nr:MAG: class I SAM-dependent methyltransferase [Alphaproteobacteria bacterium]